MNKIYSLLGIGLLSAATLSSCKEDVFIEGGDELQRGESQTYVAVASIRGYENTDKESSTRANVQDDGSSFMWNADDKVTLWNGTNGYDFTTINYDESEPSGNVEFAGMVTLKRELLFGESIRKKMFRLQGMFSLLRWEMLRKVLKKQSCRIRCTCLLKAR